MAFREELNRRENSRPEALVSWHKGYPDGQQTEEREALRKESRR